MSEACIFNIQRYSLHDGGGIRTIVFFKGCTCTCPWCCNPESLSTKPQLFYKDSLCMNCSKKINGMCETPVDECPTGAKEYIGKRQSIDAIFDIVKRDRVFYDTSGGGVTLSGGEFLLQQDDAMELLEKCKEEHIHTAVESTMSLPINDIRRLVSCVEVFLVDFKIMDVAQSTQILNLDITTMLKNVKMIKQLQGHVIARIPLIPTYTSTIENITAIMDVLQALEIEEVHLLPFHQLGSSKYKSVDKTYTCAHLQPLRDEEIEKIKIEFENKGFHTNVHGT